MVSDAWLDFVNLLFVVSIIPDLSFLCHVASVKSSPKSLKTDMWKVDFKKKTMKSLLNEVRKVL